MAVVFAFGSINTAAYFIALAAVFDFLDGLAARLLHVKSEIGKQLDSLADMVSFGLAPGVIAGLIILISVKPNINAGDQVWIYQSLPFVALLIPAFSALRLAKFNIDESQSYSFKGLPTPASALFFGSFPFIIELFPEFLNPIILISMVVIMPFLLVSNIPLFAMKFINYSWKDNMIRYLFIGISLIMLIFLQYTAVPLIILFYILLSLINK